MEFQDLLRFLLRSLNCECSSKFFAFIFANSLETLAEEFLTTQTFSQCIVRSTKTNNKRSFLSCLVSTHASFTSTIDSLLLLLFQSFLLGFFFASNSHWIISKFSINTNNNKFHATKGKAQKKITKLWIKCKNSPKAADLGMIMIAQRWHRDNLIIDCGTAGREGRSSWDGDLA